MRRVFVKTKDVRNFIGGVQAIKDRADGIESLALITGPRGSGKTRSAVWLYANSPDALYVRCKAACERPNWLLRDIVKEAGLLPDRSTEANYGKLVSYFQERPRILLIDEAQRLAGFSRLAEVAKDLSDETGLGMIFIAETGAERALTRFPSLYDRISQFVVFQALDHEDIALIINDMLEIAIDEEAIQLFVERVEPRFRPVVISLFRLERWARVMKVPVITEKHVRDMFGSKGGLTRPVRTEKPAVAA